MKHKSKALLIDLDGTLYHGKHRIDGADEWIAALQNKNIPYMFVTNNSSRTPDEVAAHLRKMGIPAGKEDVYTSALAAAQYLQELQPGARVSYIGEQGLETALRNAGMQITDENPAFVVQGIDRNFSYEKLASAANFIRSGAQYIVTNPDLLLPTDNGIQPGAGTIAAAIQAATQTEPIIIGKPSNIIMRYALEKLGCRPGEAIVIGDNAFTDLRAGESAGCDTILVLTGITTAANMKETLAKAGVKPVHICADLYEVMKITCGNEPNSGIIT